MCGIAGFRSHRKFDIEGMVKSLAHRGPDASGSFYNPPIYLGHTRLSIIDLVTGDQPMSTPDGRITIVFNGEIYNYRELRSELKSNGHSFRTESDTEVLLQLYLAHGTDMLKHLNGMFAFCIYDSREDILFGARDRMGIKPFYYTETKDGFFFASEIKALLASGAVTKKPDLVAISQYFSYRYVPGLRTAFSGINKLAPAHAFVKKSDAPLRIWRYWDFSVGGWQGDLESALEQFRELLVDSVRYRLISDVPLGMFLSGGMDSTTIVGIMKELGHDPLLTYTVSFGLEIDEKEEAAMTAQHYDCKHQCFEMPADVFDRMPDVIHKMDEPFGDTILLAYHMLSERASRSVKVVLTGEGADEGQMGYIHHEALTKALSIGNRLPKSLLTLASQLVRLIPVSLLDRGFKYPSSMGGAGRQRLSTLLKTLKRPADAYDTFISLFSEHDKRALLGPAFKEAELEAEENRMDLQREIRQSNSPLDAIFRHDYTDWLSNNILNKQDRMTMAFGLEGRVPFLDHRVVEFLASLPMDMKIRKGTGKYLLGEMHNNYYSPPSRIPGLKKAFFMPMEGKFKPAYDDFIGRYLSPSSLDPNLINPDYVQSLYSASTGKSNMLIDKQLNAVAIFNVWKEVFDIAF
jgi:asparagine synthase (glutamine-hydrolysing)